MASLRESLKELENPASSVNFEDSEDEFTFAKVVEGAEESAENEEDTKNFGNLRKKAALQEQHFEKKYSGNKVSRKRIEEWSDEENDSLDEDGLEDEDNDSIPENDIEESKEDVDEEEEDNSSMIDYEDHDIEGDDVEEESDIVDEDDIEEDSNFGDEDFEDDDGAIHLDISKIPKDLLGDGVSNEIEEEGEDDNDDDVENFKSSNVNIERKKGEATKIQLDLLDKLLETRIRLQKSMQVVNTLPQKANIKTFIREGGPQIHQSHKNVKSSLSMLLNNLLKLQAELLETNEETENILLGNNKSKKEVDEDEEIPSDTDDENEKENDDKEEEETEDSLKLPSKRKSTLSFDDFEEELNKRHKSMVTFRDATITKWYDKTRLMTGKMNKGFSAFETSTLQQVKQVLSDRERLIKRCQLKRTTYKILGKIDEVDDHKGEQETDSHLKNYDEEIFDDSDFYHEMLKELIERKSNLSSNVDDPVASGRRWLQLQKLRTKVKKKIDTRASKGRKVRYDVHSKLVSFMAPQEVGTMSDQARNDLFSSLFGGMVKAGDVIDR